MHGKTQSLSYFFQTVIIQINWANRRGEDGRQHPVQTPSIVPDYQQNMRGVDLADHMVAVNKYLYKDSYIGAIFVCVLYFPYFTDENEVLLILLNQFSSTWDHQTMEY